MQLIFNQTKSFLLFITSGLVTLTASPTLAAEINKWIDAQGKVHYGAQPPNDRTATKITNPPPGSSIPAVSTTEVVLYSTSWCGYCRQARAFMSENNISFVERDIEKDRRGKLEYDRLGGRGVPFLVRDGEEVLRGFNIQSYEQFFSQN